MKIIESEPIDINKTEIKSDIKTFVAIIASTITIISSIFLGVDHITSSIIELKVSFEKQNEMNDLRYRTFDQRVTHDENDIADIRKMKDKQQQ